MSDNHSTDYYARAAKRGGCPVVEGKNHTRIYPPDGVQTDNAYPFMSMPRHCQLSKGVEAKIRKWLAAVGVLLTLGLVAAMIALG